MKAVVLQRPETLTVSDLPDPEPPTGYVRIRVQAASICGSDMLRVYSGHAKVYPIVLGHEFSGTIDRVNEVDPGLIGQRVAVAPLIPCMSCDACQAGLYACCTQYSFIGSRVNGAFAEYVIAPAANLVLLPQNFDMAIGALVEPISVGMHAIARGGGAQGRIVAIVGVGSIGLLTVKSALWSRARAVVAVDISDENLDAAREFGAELLINPRRENAVEALRASYPLGANLVIEASGAQAGLEQSILLCRAGGHVVCVGNQPAQAALPMRYIEHVMRQELHLAGAWMSYSAPFPGQEWRDAVDVLAHDGTQLAEMFTHSTTLQELPDMFSRLREGGFSHQKVLVTYL